MVILVWRNSTCRTARTERTLRGRNSLRRRILELCMAVNIRVSQWSQDWFSRDLV